MANPQRRTIFLIGKALVWLRIFNLIAVASASEREDAIATGKIYRRQLGRRSTDGGGGEREGGLQGPHPFNISSSVSLVGREWLMAGLPPTEESDVRQLGNNDEVARPRIIGGNPTDGQQYPFFVQADTVESNYYCGGSLVAPDVVLTAAHCINAFNSTRVLVGPYIRDSTDGPAEWRNIESNLVVHPGYTPTEKRFDFLVFKIEAVTLPNLVPVVLNSNRSDPTSGQPMTVLGMGKTSNDDASLSDVLREVVVEAIPQSACASAFQDFITIDETSMLCGSTTSGKDSCGGDSGGPLIDDQMRLLGVVSFGGPLCAAGTYPSVYARVSGALDWIQEQICQLSNSDPAYCSSVTIPPSPPPQLLPPASRRPTTTRRPVAPQGNNVTYRIEVKYDILPGAFAWKVTEPGRGRRRRRRGRSRPRVRRQDASAVVVSYPMGSITTPFHVLVKRIRLRRGRTYRLVLKDHYGLGLIGGYVKLYRGSTLVRRIKGESIGRRKRITFRAR